MDAPMLITLIVFLFMIVSFSRHRIPMALTSVIGLLVPCLIPRNFGIR